MYNYSQFQYANYATPNHKFKTQLCRHFSQNGVCAMAQRCQFAHGQEELRSINDPIPTTQQQYPIAYTPQYAYKEPDQQQQINFSSQVNNQQILQQQATQQILVVILVNMEKIFQNDQMIIALLKQGQELAQAGNIHGASEIIKKIINDSARSKEEKQMYQTIYDNAQKVYNNMMSQQQKP